MPPVDSQAPIRLTAFCRCVWPADARKPLLFAPSLYFIEPGDSSLSTWFTVIFGDIDGGDAMGWGTAVLLGIPFVILPQVAMIRYVCQLSKIRFPQSHMWALAGTVFSGLILLVCVLRSCAAKEVRTDAAEILFLTAMGGVWSLAAVALFPWLGLSLRNDAMERRNAAAMVASLGALFAVQLTFAGGNVGEGPSYWNNVFSAALGTGGVLCLWFLLELGGGVSASIAEDRDLASGVRLCGFLERTSETVTS